MEIYHVDSKQMTETVRKVGGSRGGNYILGTCTSFVLWDPSILKPQAGDRIISSLSDPRSDQSCALGLAFDGPLVIQYYRLLPFDRGIRTISSLADQDCQRALGATFDCALDADR